MPYEIVRRDDEYCVMKEDDGSILGCHPTRAEAIDQMQAIAISENKDMNEEMTRTLMEILFGDEKAEGYKPTDSMVSNARQGLEWRKEYGRGGTEVGVARARDIVNRRSLSADTVKRMYSYFSRHEVDKQGEGFSSGEDGYPSAGKIAWQLWGGDSGYSWSRRIANSLKDDKAEPNELSVGDFVSWDSSGGRSQGRITRIVRDGEIDVPDSSFTVQGEEDNPAALIRVYRETDEGWEATDTQVGHRFSTLTKIEAL